MPKVPASSGRVVKCIANGGFELKGFPERAVCQASLVEATERSA